MNKLKEFAWILRIHHKEAVPAELENVKDIDPYLDQYNTQLLYRRFLRSAQREDAYNAIHFKGFYFIPLNLESSHWMLTKGNQILYIGDIHDINITLFPDIMTLAETEENIDIPKIGDLVPPTSS